MSDDGSAENTRPVVTPPGSPQLTALLRLAVAAVVVAALFVAQGVLIPIILAIILSFVLSPLVSALGRLGVPRAPSVMLAVAATFGVVVLAGTLLAGQAATLAANAPRYATTIQHKLEGIELMATARLASVTRLFPRTPPVAGAAVAVAPPPSIARPIDAAALAAAAAAEGRPVLVEIARTETSPLTVMRSILEPILGPLETTIIVLVIAIFILLEREDLRDRVIRLAGADDLHRTMAAMDDAAQRLSRYFLSQLLVNGTFGVVVGLGLWAFGIPSPALWGALAGLLRFVPYIGAILGAVPPVVLAAAIDPGWWLAAEVALLFLVIEPVTGYVVEPLLYGHSTGLAPVSVIVAAVFWTWIWGPIGLILSTPVTLCLVVMGRHVKSLEFFDVMLGDRPALAPVETLYQRILADNPDEVLEKAEAFLAERSILEYYDEVVVQGLKLAAQDEARGRLSPERATEMTRLLLQVIDDLRDYREGNGAKRNSAVTEPARTVPLPEAAGGTVACISGRGVFDDAVSAMLVQLLEREGHRTRRIRHHEVSRDRIAQLDLTGVGVIVLSYLDMAGTLSHLRYVVRRLRHHAPGVPIIVGLWPGEGDPADDSARWNAVGADAKVRSLRDAVESVRARSSSSASALNPDRA